MMQAAKRELPKGSNSENVRIWDRDICLHLLKVSCKAVINDDDWRIVKQNISE